MTTTTSNQQIATQTNAAIDFLTTYKGAIAKALGNDFEQTRMLSILMNEFRLNPKLLTCTQQSLVTCILQSCQLGLRPGALLGQFYLIPYENHKKKTLECQFILGYKGMIELACRGDGVKKIEAHGIYEQDNFNFEYGTDSFLKHVPAKAPRGRLVGAWAMAILKSGEKQFHVIDEEEIIAAKTRSKTDMVWSVHYEAMARKTAVRRLFNYLPINPDIQLALALDDAADRGEQIININPTETTKEIPQEPVLTIETKVDNVEQLKDVLNTNQNQ